MSGAGLASLIDFYQDFSQALQSEDWEAVLARISFPFVFYGHIDDDTEGELKLSKQQFSVVFKKFLELETHNIVANEMLLTSYRQVLTNGLVDIREIDEQCIQFHCFVYQCIEGHWKLAKIYSDIDEIKKLL